MEQGITLTFQGLEWGGKEMYEPRDAPGAVHSDTQRSGALLLGVTLGMLFKIGFLGPLEVSLKRWIQYSPGRRKLFIVSRRVKAKVQR